MVSEPRRSHFRRFADFLDLMSSADTPKLDPISNRCSAALTSFSAQLIEKKLFREDKETVEVGKNLF